jgi:hypothetical protein
MLKSLLCAEFLAWTQFEFVAIILSLNAHAGFLVQFCCASSIFSVHTQSNPLFTHSLEYTESVVKQG